MKKYIQMLACIFVGVVALSACSTNNEHRYARHHTHDSVRYADDYGVVTDIDIVDVESRTSGGGAVLGAVLGGVIGHQIGGGRGNDIATGAGAIGGAVAGNQIEKRNAGENQVYRITVRFENGAKQRFDYRDLNGLRVGDKVKVENGQLYQR